MLMLAFIGAIVMSGQGVALAICSERMVRRARNTVFQHLLRQDIAFFDAPDHSAGALSNLLSARAADLDGLSGSSLGMLLVGGSTIVSGIVVACAVGWKLGLVCAAVSQCPNLAKGPSKANPTHLTDHSAAPSRRAPAHVIPPR